MLRLILLIASFPVALVAAACLLVYYTGRKNDRLIAFFHPYCAAGGGGERVLWTALRDMQIKYPNFQFRIYTGDSQDPKQIIQHARERFGVEISLDRLEFCKLHSRILVEDIYPALTLLMQSLGSMVLGLEALLSTRSDLPSVIFDTMGYSFTYPLFKMLGRCRVGCYVHYPTISSDMISAVRLGRPSVNNRRPITAISSLKLVYYRCFALLYAKVGGYAECVMVNSSWTLGHIKEIWATDKCAIVYPPCDVCALSQLPDEKHESGDEAFILVSVAQFRPEKDHQLQLEAFAEFRRRHPSAKARLLLIGGARNFQDRKRVSELQQFAKDYGLTTSVEFLINVDYEQLKNYLGSAVIGLHTMWNEHFGIGIVEYLAAGVIPIAHRSGGPRLDIIKPFHNQPVGLLAETKQEYALAIEQIAYGMSAEERRLMRQRGRQSVLQRFSEQQFINGWHRQIAPLISEII